MKCFAQKRRCNLNFESGTLENVSEINGGSGFANSVLVKTTTGTLILDGTNTYSGGTTVADGTLILTNSEAIADGTSLTVGDASAFGAPVVPPAIVGSNVASPAIAPVPEPGTLALLVGGLIVAFGVWRKSHRS